MVEIAILVTFAVFYDVAEQLNWKQRSLKYMYIQHHNLTSTMIMTKDQRNDNRMEQEISVKH